MCFLPLINHHGSSGPISGGITRCQKRRLYVFNTWNLRRRRFFTADAAVAGHCSAVGIPIVLRLLSCKTKSPFACEFLRSQGNRASAQMPFGLRGKSIELWYWAGPTTTRWQRGICCCHWQSTCCGIALGTANYTCACVCCLLAHVKVTYSKGFWIPSLMCTPLVSGIGLLVVSSCQLRRYSCHVQDEHANFAIAFIII